jgi:PKD repeat protein
MKKTIALGIVVLIIGVSITPVISGSSKQVENHEVLKSLNKKSGEIEIIVDQAVETVCNGSYGSNNIYSYIPLGQSFIPLYEFHYGIELYFEDYNPQHPPLPIQIWLKENNITGPKVPGTNVTLNLTLGDGWNFFEFDTPVNLTINQTYVIDISTTTSKWGIRRTLGTCYQRGIAFYSGEPNHLSDLYFRTYVIISIEPVANFTYSVEESPVLFNGSSSYDLDGYIVSYEWDFGDGKTGSGEITYHKYCKVGTYDVKLNVTDDDGLKGNITKSVDVLFANIPPLIPEIYGPGTGKPGVEYEYAFNVKDPDDYIFFLWVDWGDGNSTGWKGPYHTGESLKLNHSWNETGIYVIKAKVKDFCDESPWGTLEVTIPRNKATNNQLYYNTARLNWNEYNIEYEYSHVESFGNSGEGPLGFLTYAYGLVIKSSIFILNGTINVKPQNAPRLTLQSGDRISMLILFHFGLSDDYNHDINIGRAFGVTVEKA